MVKNNKNLNKTPGGITTRNKRRSKRQRDVTQASAVKGLVVSKPFSSVMSQESPGRASMRATFQVLSDTSHGGFSMTVADGFPSWAPKVATLLGSFKFWRLVDAKLTYTVTGGAASPYYIIGNVSNNPLTYDVSVIDVLDDDYAGVANGVEQLVLAPPKSYWRQGLSNWKTTGVASDLSLTSAGVFTFVGGGGATPTTVVGWCTIDLEIEFHTM